MLGRGTAFEKAATAAKDLTFQGDARERLWRGVDTPGARDAWSARPQYRARPRITRDGVTVAFEQAYAGARSS
jgi:hypothetical protein